METSRSRLPACLQNVLLSRDGRFFPHGTKGSRGSPFFRGLPTLILLASLTSGCNAVYPKGENSIVIVSVPNFRADDLGCGSSSESITPQIDVICNEGVRFTHAYTTSVLVVPALASILTGLYPFEHGIHRNDASFYAQGIKSLPELAKENGFETFLVSGGVPILKKTGIEKGFSDFDDNIRGEGGFYRPAEATVKKFFNLLENRGEGVPFVGVLDLADLSFPEVFSLKTGQSEKKEGMYNGKLQEIDEAIGGLRNEFIKMKIWDQMTVVIVGLQGADKGEHDGLSKGISLYDEIVRVPLLIKPARKPRDQGPSWKIDAPVDLADLGLTLINLVGAKDFKRSSAPVIDFGETLIGKGNSGKEFQTERPLFCESDLPPWRGWGPRLVSMRQGEWVFWPSPEDKLFDTYSDRLELRNLFSMDFNMVSRLKDTWKNYSKFFLEFDAGVVKFMPISIGEKLKTAKVIFSRSSEPQEKIRALDDLELRRPDDWQAVQWHAQELLENRDWNGIKNLLQKVNPTAENQKRDLVLWKKFLHLKLKGRSGEKDMVTDPTQNCLNLALSIRHEGLPPVDYFQGEYACKDHEIQAWVTAFIYFKGKRMREAAAFYEMARAASEKRLDQIEFAKYFWLNGATWDFPPELPGAPAVFDFFTELVPNTEFQNFIKKKQFP